MKKSFALILLAFGSTIAVCALTLLNMLLTLSMEMLCWVGLTVGAAAAAFAAYCLRRLFLRKFPMKTAAFFLCANALPLIGTWVFFAVAAHLADVDFNEYYELLLVSRFGVVTSAEFAAAGLLWANVLRDGQPQKPLLGLFAGGLAAVLALSGPNLWAVANGPTLLLAAAWTMAAALPFEPLRRKLALDMKRFLLCAYLPSLIFSGAAALSPLVIPALWEFNPLIIGAFTALPTSAAMLLGAALWHKIFKLLDKRKEKP
ncbi:MAG: hypothetical protein NC299_03860 [Lachnospiraceae bacterium]|nr:hypothetical protein [Ruminococcus sp.]MCM1274482.1 hypothetical protein [Lachnospiraceae bacterium]